MKIETVYEAGNALARIASNSGHKDLVTGDIIKSINGKAIRNRLDYELALVDLQPGHEAEVKFEHDGEESLCQIRCSNSSAAPSSIQSPTHLVSSTVGKVTATTSADAALRLFGIRLEPADAAKVRAADSNYKGGLRVVSVRPGSPAFNAQIKPGDILVGLLDWQTPDWSDLAYIFNSAELKSSKSPKFHIMRGRELFWGNLELASGR